MGTLIVDHETLRKLIYRLDEAIPPADSDDYEELDEIRNELKDLLHDAEIAAMRET
jgi:hypothetical protein